MKTSKIKDEYKKSICMEMAVMYWSIGDRTMPMADRLKLINIYLAASGVTGITTQEKRRIMKAIEAEQEGKGELEFICEKARHCAKSYRV